MSQIKAIPLSYELVNWKDISEQVKKHNHEFFSLLENITHINKYKLIQVEYLYGTNIIKEGIINIPNKNNQLIPLDSPCFPEELRKMLSYSPIPFGLLLNKVSEVYIELDERIVPLNIIPPGEFFGLFELLSTLNNTKSIPIWNVYAGARSTFMLPRITDSYSHRRLRNELGISSNTPTMPTEHANIFSQINAQESTNKQWKSQVIFFTGEWFDLIKNNSTFKEISHYFFKLGWGYKDDRTASILWESSANAIAKRRLKLRPYLLDTVKHIFYMGMGHFPGFNAADAKELDVPTKVIQDCYVNVYSLKEYLPIIMRSTKVRHTEYSIYYFMTYPTLLAGFPTVRSTPSILMDIKDIKRIIETLHNKLPQVAHPEIYKIISDIHFEFYHSEFDKMQEIQHSSLLPKNNPHILGNCNKYKDRSFPVNSPFMAGCIEISLRDKKFV